MENNSNDYFEVGLKNWNEENFDEAIQKIAANAIRHSATRKKPKPTSTRLANSGSDNSFGRLTP